MKYRDLLSRLGSTLLVESESLCKLIQLSDEEIRADIFGAETQSESMEIRDGIAIIPISGFIGRGLGGIPGAVDPEEVARCIREADGRKDVKSILLDIDSPGGAVNGSPELAAVVRRAEKPIFAYTGGLMASAAYWLASGADRIYATPSATVGSIGVLTAHLDVSQAFAMAGMKMDVIASGPHKGAGMMGTALTSEQRNFAQNKVNKLATVFQEDVSTMRNIDLEDMQGQSFSGFEAEKNGFVDEVVPDFESVIAILR